MRWNGTKGVALVQNLDEHGPPWLGTIRHLDLLDQYGATSALHELPRDLGLFDPPEAAQLAVERDAMNVYARRAHIIRLAAERRERHARALAA